MSGQRITQAELHDLKREAEYESIETTRPRHWDSETVLRLVDELLRLRGLIAASIHPRREDRPGAFLLTQELAAEAHSILEENPGH